ncbi:hypothetical protein ACSQ67_005456 [Phaseolus vulgaris]
MFFLFLLTEKKSTYKGKSSIHLHHFWLSSSMDLYLPFDCDYAYVLGHICYHTGAGLNGYMASSPQLTSKNPVNKWRCGAAPIAAVEKKMQKAFTMDDIYRNPGPLQFDGPGADFKVITTFC